MSSPWLHYQIHLDVVRGSSGCIFSLEKSLGVALKNAFQQKDQIWYQYLVVIYFCPITVWPFLSQYSLGSPVSLFVWLGFFASYSLFKQYKKLLIWGFIPQAPGVLICNRVRTESPYQPYLLSAVLCLRLSKLELELTAGFIFLSFALVDANANFYHASLSSLWARLQKMRVCVMIRSL